MSQTCHVLPPHFISPYQSVRAPRRRLGSPFGTTWGRLADGKTQRSMCFWQKSSMVTVRRKKSTEKYLKCKRMQMCWCVDSYWLCTISIRLLKYVHSAEISGHLWAAVVRRCAYSSPWRPQWRSAADCVGCMGRTSSTEHELVIGCYRWLHPIQADRIGENHHSNDELKSLRTPRTCHFLWGGNWVSIHSRMMKTWKTI